MKDVYSPYFEHMMLSLSAVKQQFPICENAQQKINGRADYITFPLTKSTTIWCVKPPEAFPDALLCFRFEYKDTTPEKMEEVVFERRQKRIKKQLGAFISPHAHDLMKPMYFGVAPCFVNEYTYLLYHPAITDAALCAEEKRFIYAHSHDAEVTEYYKIRGHYHKTDQRSVAQFREFYQSKQTQEWLTPRWFHTWDTLQYSIPVGLLNGEKPLYYFSPNLRFTPNPTKYFGQLVLPLWERTHFGASPNKQAFHSANELFYAFEKEIPDIRERLTIYEEPLRGDALPALQVGDQVIITMPSERKEALLGSTGVISNIAGVMATVRFMNYFEEIFHVRQLTKETL